MANYINHMLMTNKKDQKTVATLNVEPSEVLCIAKRTQHHTHNNIISLANKFTVFILILRMI